MVAEYEFKGVSRVSCDDPGSDAGVVFTSHVMANSSDFYHSKEELKAILVAGIDDQNAN